MKVFIIILATILGINIGFSEEKRGNWTTFYYQDPSPDAFSIEVLAMAEAGILRDENAYGTLIGFLSQSSSTISNLQSLHTQGFTHLGHQCICLVAVHPPGDFDGL
ncbi:hypothetical protein [Luteolibacter sp. AS25]|uniref:hypothetical protein n=1 Tax=Luteolibacter sp. AS25 TaxID=3135776 RepID=UPI00398AD631